MRITTIHPLSTRRLSGTLHAPASKSVAQRALALALLAVGTRTTIYHIGDSDDERVAMYIIQTLGARVQHTPDSEAIEVYSSGIHPRGDTVHCGESGLSARMFLPIAAQSRKVINFTGEGSLLQRDMRFYYDLLPQLGVRILLGNAPQLPIRFQGPLQPKDIHIDAASGSQFLTGLLFSFASLALEKTVHIHVAHLSSRPYIDLTLAMLSLFGATVTHENYAHFTITAQEQTLHAVQPIYVEGDFSGAAYLLVMAVCYGQHFRIERLFQHSVQGDRAIVSVLQAAGAKLHVHENFIDVFEEHEKLQAFHFDATHTPDLFPPLVALALACEGESTIIGVHRLHGKESNRAETLLSEFEKLGAHIRIKKDTMYVRGGRIRGGEVSAHNDHRIAMALAIAALGAKNPITIHGSETVSKSYPHFFSELEKTGVRMTHKNM